MSMIPETAPFSEERRAWLNGFFSGLLGLEPNMVSNRALAAAGLTAESFAAPVIVPVQDEEEFPWHEPELPIVERMALAEGKPLEHKMMAAMAQLDCGTCGYLCQTYSEAIALGQEADVSLCSPGGKETKQMLKKLLKENDRIVPAISVAPAIPVAAPQEDGYTRNNPLTATLIESRKLNLEGSTKDTRHVAIDLSGSNLIYHAGDTLGVWPTNCAEFVKAVIARLDADETVEVKTPLGNTKSLLDSLCEDCCLKDPTDELLELLINRTNDPEAKETMQQMLDEGIPDGYDVLDALETASDVKLSAEELVSNTDSLKPRLYSIASSMKAVGSEVHLTIGKVTYEREGRLRKGVASTMFADRMEVGAQVRVYPMPNHTGFTIPADTATPIIMVGPGTGIAPFIAFLQERAATQSPGKNWLLFGDRNEAFDFLYEAELKDWQDAGVITRLDTAFSRDSDEKVYVQDRMRENGAEMWQWLQDGAHFYVCGDASRMAPDVDRALRDICQEHGSMSAAQAKEFVAQLAKDKRYVRDVY